MNDVSDNELIKVLGRCEVFMGLTDDDLRKVALLPSTHFETYDVDTTVTKATEAAENIYILVDGQVDLWLTVENVLEKHTHWIKVDTVRKGSVFGWSALVQPYAYSRTAICSMKSYMLAINGKELIGLMDRDEHIGYEVMRSIACVIASRLRTPNHFFWAESIKTRNGVNS